MAAQHARQALQGAAERLLQGDLARRLAHQGEAEVRAGGEQRAEQEDQGELVREGEFAVEDAAQHEARQQRQGATDAVAQRPEGAEAVVGHHLGGDVGERHAAHAAGERVDQHHRQRQRHQDRRLVPDEEHRGGEHRERDHAQRGGATVERQLERDVGEARRHEQLGQEPPAHPQRGDQADRPRGRAEGGEERREDQGRVEERLAAVDQDAVVDAQEEVAVRLAPALRLHAGMLPPRRAAAVGAGGLGGHAAVCAAAAPVPGAAAAPSVDQVPLERPAHQSCTIAHAELLGGPIAVGRDGLLGDRQAPPRSRGRCCLCAMPLHHFEFAPGEPRVLVRVGCPRLTAPTGPTARAARSTRRASRPTPRPPAASRRPTWARTPILQPPGSPRTYSISSCMDSATRRSDGRQRAAAPRRWRCRSSRAATGRAARRRARAPATRSSASSPQSDSPTTSNWSCACSRAP
jgi:hypothetical protein